MNVIIENNEGKDTISIDETMGENNFYKIIASKIAEYKVPNKIKISCIMGEAEYSIIPRSGTKFIKEIRNTINIPIGNYYDICYLVCINADKNNYKYYKIVQNKINKNEITAFYGRIGTKKGEMYGERSYSYPSRMYWIKYMEKISKGYVDKSKIYLHPIEKNDKKNDKKINIDILSKDNVSEYLFYKLQLFAKNKVETTCINANVTKQMIKESKKIMKKMYNRKTVKGFNKQLLELLEIAPRRVYKVSQLLAEKKEDFPTIIDREENLIMAMETLVPTKLNTLKKSFKDFEVEVYLANEKQKEIVLSHLNDKLKTKVKNIYRVINKKTQKDFDKYLKDNNISVIKQLWHGSRNENWGSIIINGLKLNPNAVITGKMFGNGIYFANSSLKSWNYTSHQGSYWVHGSSKTGFMGLYATAYGTPLDVSLANDYNQENLKKQNKNCVHAHAGRQLMNDEIIYYSESSMTINYVVEFE